MKKISLSVFILFLTVTNAIAQCPMCKASVESSRTLQTKSVGNGLNIGILMLLGTVYVIAAVVGYLWYKNYKQNLATSHE